MDFKICLYLYLSWIIVFILSDILTELNLYSGIGRSEGTLVAAVGCTYKIKSKKQKYNIRYWISKWTIKKAGRNKDLTLVIIPFQVTHFPFYTSRKKCLVFWCFQGLEKGNITWNGFILNTLNSEPNLNCYCTFWLAPCVICFMILNWHYEVVQQRKCVKSDFLWSYCRKCLS